MATLTLHPGKFPIHLDKVNQTSQFISTDSEQAFQENYNKLHSYYKTADITYVNNEHGFRAQPFDSYKGKFGLAIGCSHTYGVGVRAEDTWHAELGRLLNMPFVNLGCESHGPQAVCRVAREWCNYYAKPSIVVIQLPELSRGITATLQKGHTTHQGVSVNEWHTKLESTMVISNEGDLTQEFVTAEAINTTVEHFVAQQIPVRLWSYTDDHAVNRHVKYNIQGIELTQIDVDNFLARDLAHQGHVTQFRVAGEVAEHCKNLNVYAEYPSNDVGTLNEENQKEFHNMLRANNRIIYN